VFIRANLQVNFSLCFLCLFAVEIFFNLPSAVLMLSFSPIADRDSAIKIAAKKDSFVLFSKTWCRFHPLVNYIAEIAFRHAWGKIRLCPKLKKNALAITIAWSLSSDFEHTCIPRTADKRRHTIHNRQANNYGKLRNRKSFPKSSAVRNSARETKAVRFSPDTFHAKENHATGG